MGTDAVTNVAELRTQVQRFVDERDWGKFHNPKDLADCLPCYPLNWDFPFQLAVRHPDPHCFVTNSTTMALSCQSPIGWQT